jgi:opacity protein-like surface antigen
MPCCRPLRASSDGMLKCGVLPRTASLQHRGSALLVALLTRWLATARIRVGWAYDNISYYATGGAGYVHFGSNAPDGTAFITTHTAWVAGLGQESAINRNLLLRFEVLYLSFLGNHSSGYEWGELFAVNV